MIRFTYSYRMIFLAVILAIILVGGFLAGCNSLAPVMSYQGRLTNAAGQPLNGIYSFILRLFPVSTGGTAVYTETKNIAVSNGLFDTSIGPATLVANLRPEWLAQPLWLDVTINGEVLTPRQQLLGAPYAFTLMPGAVISSTFDSTIPGTSAEAIVKIINNDTGTDSHPALKVVGNKGIELVDASGGHGTIYSDQSQTASSLQLHSNNAVSIFLDEDSTSNAERFYVYGSDTSVYCYFDGTSGVFHCPHGFSTATLVNNEDRALYAIESPDVMFEDFGGGTLVNGVGQVTIDPLFAATVNLNDYHVFVTPLGDCQGLYVTKKTATGFEVHELGGGTASVAFDYRIVAKRLGYEDVRMEVLTPAETDGEGK